MVLLVEAWQHDRHLHVGATVTVHCCRLVASCVVTGLRITCLAGGVGAARFLTGLLAVLDEDHPGSEVTVVGNTADDVTLFGLHISPDLDTVMYTIGGGVHSEQGWGRADETFTTMAELAAYGVEPQWFSLGDRDLATHVVRTQMLSGYPLSAVTAALSQRWLADLPVPVTLLPMTDDRVETHVVVDDPERGRAGHALPGVVGALPGVPTGPSDRARRCRGGPTSAWCSRCHRRSRRGSPATVQPRREHRADPVGAWVA